MVKGVDGKMLIGELSKRSGLTRDTIRFYEKESLIGARNQDKQGFRTNTYKDYPESTVADLRFIQRTKVLGFTLSEIRNMLSLRGQERPSKKWAAEAQGKLRDIDEKIQELMDVKRLLGEALARCSDQCFDAGCDVLDGAVAGRPGWAARPHRDGSSVSGGNCCTG